MPTWFSKLRDMAEDKPAEHWMARAVIAIVLIDSAKMER